MQIAIVGAGPAGSIAALRLARAGAAVSLFDPTHPREKPCGGGVTGRALDLIADVIDVSTLPFVVATTANVEPPDTTNPPARVALVDRGAVSASSLLVLSRAVFDRALLDAALNAGARLIAERVIDVTVGGDRQKPVIRTEPGVYAADAVL